MDEHNRVKQTASEKTLIVVAQTSVRICVDARDERCGIEITAEDHVESARRQIGDCLWRRLTRVDSLQTAELDVFIELDHASDRVHRASGRVDRVDVRARERRATLGIDRCCRSAVAPCTWTTPCRPA